MDGKPGVSGSRIFGCYFFGQNGTPPFVMGRGYPLELCVLVPILEGFQNTSLLANHSFN